MLLTLLAAGCASLPEHELQQLSVSADIPPQVELDETPFYAQQRYQCGPAALATVLNSYGAGVTPADLVAEVYIPARRGSLPEEMSAAARRHGMLAYPLPASLTELLRELSAGHPVLVFQNLGLSWLPKWHYAVVVGYDLDDQVLVLRSATSRRRLVTLATFLHTWKRADYWARVIVPAGQIPASADHLNYLQAAHELEQTAGSASALPALQAAVERWPAEHLAWLALGNTRYALHQTEAAEQAVRNALQLAPDSAQAWNNLAYLLLERACPQQALVAVHCARQLDPAAAYRESARDIGLRATGSDAPYCRGVRCPLSAP